MALCQKKKCRWCEAGRTTSSIFGRAPARGCRVLHKAPGDILQNISFASIGDPRDAKTWSGTPLNLILALEEAGCCVTGVDLQLPPIIRRLLKGLSMGTGMGTDYMRTRATRRIVSARHRLKSVSDEPKPTIHMGTLTIPVGSNRRSGGLHYIFI